MKPFFPDNMQNIVFEPTLSILFCTFFVEKGYWQKFRKKLQWENFLKIKSTLIFWRDKSNHEWLVLNVGLMLPLDGLLSLIPLSILPLDRLDDTSVVINTLGSANIWFASSWKVTGVIDLSASNLLDEERTSSDNLRG